MPSKSYKRKVYDRKRYEMNCEKRLQQMAAWDSANIQRARTRKRFWWGRVHCTKELKTSRQCALVAKAGGKIYAKGKIAGRKKAAISGKFGVILSTLRKESKGAEAGVRIKKHKGVVTQNRVIKKWSSSMTIYNTAVLVKQMSDQRRSINLLVPKAYIRRGHRALLRSGQSKVESDFVTRLIVGCKSKVILKRKQKDLGEVTEAKQLVRRALNIRREYVSTLKKGASYLKSVAEEILARAEENGGESMEDYCGPAEHRAWREPYFKEFAYDYTASSVCRWDPSSLTEHCSIHEEKEPSEIHLRDVTYPIRGKELTALLKKVHWECSEYCLPPGDHLKLKTLLEEFYEIEEENVRQFLEENDLDECGNPKERGKKGHSKQCLTGKCDSILLYLRRLAVHYPRIRKLVEGVYNVRRWDRLLFELDCALLMGRKGKLKQVLKKCPKAIFTEEESDLVPVEKKLSEIQYARRFNAKLQEKVPEYTCVECFTLHCRRAVVKVTIKGTERDRKLYVGNKEEIQNKLWKDVLCSLPKKNTVDFYVCYECLKCLREGEDHHRRSIHNTLDLDEVPKVLTELNEIETTLVQKAKCFQTVVRLGVVNSKLPASDRLQVIKGQVLYYPLPLEKTIEELDSATGQPSHSQVQVLVNGVPTKKRIIWQSLVNVDKVKKALRWLKNNNEIYKDVNVDSWLDPFWYELEDEEATQEELRECQAFTCNRAEMTNFHLNENVEILVPGLGNEKPMIKKVTKEEEAYIMDNFTIHPLYQRRAKEADLDLYQMKRVEGQKMDNREASVDVSSFPKLYPRGRGGKGEKRKQAITGRDFIRTRLYNKDGRFRRSAQYIFSLLWDYELRSLAPGVFQCIRSSRAQAGATVGEFLRHVEGGDQQLEASLTTIFEQMRGTSEYWDRRNKELQCMVRELGPFTFFVTLSPAEYDWEDMERVLLATNKDMPGFEKLRRGERCALDPVYTAKYFHEKFRSIFDSVMCAEGGGPLGVVKDYFWRVEYQSRGMPHIHMAVWIEDAPRLGIDDVDTVKAFLKDKISCKMPDSDTEPLLHAAVSKYQKHRCNAYCMKARKVNGRFVTRCRFGFPRREMEEIQINDPVKTTAARSRGITSSRLVELPRTAFETDINDYNPILLLLWNGNIDVQYVGESTGAVANYIVGYLTKAETSHNEGLWEEIDRNQSLAKQLYSFSFRKLSHRECGVVEAVDKLAGQELYGKSQETKYINARLPHTRRRRLKSLAQLRELADNDPNSTEKYENDWMNTYYPKRPAIMEDMCLYDFLRWYNKCNEPEKEMAFLDGVPGGVVRRKKPFLISHPVYKKAGQENEYCYSLLLMFKPFRKEVEELLGENGDCRGVFESELAKPNVRLVEHHNRLQGQFLLEEEREEKLEQANVVLEENENERGEPTDDDIFGCPGETGNAMAELAAMTTVNSTETWEGNLAKMNEGQARVFNRITSHMETERNPLRLFVSGSGGTGKSFLIESLKLWFSERHQSAVSLAVAAPTGLAAFNVGGITLHRLFDFRVQHKSIAPYNSLSEPARKEMKMMLRDQKLLIIDEISMVSNLLLAYVHKRLCEIFNTDEDVLFGGISVVVMGDLAQLPPVKADPVFSPISAGDLTKKLGGMGYSLQFWEDAFTEYEELTESMRHKADPEYAAVLERVRWGKMTEADVKVLQTRLIPLDRSETSAVSVEKVADWYEMLKKVDSSLVCLLSKSKMVKQLNECLLRREKSEIVEILAVDDPKRKLSKKDLDAAKKSLAARKDSVTDTAGVETLLRVCIGARVMLRRNIMVERGLTNGALGTVVGFEVEPTGIVRAIKVCFDNDKETIHPIGRIEADFKLSESLYVTRKQFPLILAYAMSIHKSQGLTFSQIMLDAGNSIFDTGMTYVGLSRVRTLAGLHLLNFDPKQAKCSVKCIEEINRLRGPNVKQLSLEFTVHKRKTDRKWYDETDEQEEPDQKERRARKRKGTGSVTMKKEETGTSKRKRKETGAVTETACGRAGAVSNKSKLAGKAARKENPRVVLRRNAEGKCLNEGRKEIAERDQNNMPPGLAKQSGNVETGPLNGHGPKPPGIENREKFVCYSNSAMQAVLSLQAFRDQCRNLRVEGQNFLVQRVQRALTRFVKEFEEEEELPARDQLTLSTDMLRLALAAMGHPFSNADGQQDTRDFLQSLLDRAQIEGLFDAHTQDTFSCPLGHVRSSGLENLGFLAIIPPTEGGSLENLIAWTRIGVDECQECGNRLGVVATREVISVTNQALVWIERYAEDNANTAPIWPFDPDQATIGGYSFRTVAAIEHHGPNRHAGHYLAYVRRGNTWWKCNDETVTELDGIPPGMRRICLLVMEKTSEPAPVLVNIV